MKTLPLARGLLLDLLLRLCHVSLFLLIIILIFKTGLRLKYEKLYTANLRDIYQTLIETGELG